MEYAVEFSLKVSPRGEHGAPSVATPCYIDADDPLVAIEEAIQMYPDWIRKFMDSAEGAAFLTQTRWSPA